MGESTFQEWENEGLSAKNADMTPSQATRAGDIVMAVEVSANSSDEAAKVDKYEEQTDQNNLDEKLITKRESFTKSQTLIMAYQTLGVVYGDLGTSSLYVFSPTNIKHPDEDDILGIFSLIFWGLTLIGLVKYTFIVLHAGNEGEGGTFAVYSLLCRHLNLGQKNGNHRFDVIPSTHQPKGTVNRMTRRLLEKNQYVQKLLIIFVMIGTSMVIGDGVLNPAISGDLNFPSLSLPGRMFNEANKSDKKAKIRRFYEIL